MQSVVAHGHFHVYRTCYSLCVSAHTPVCRRGLSGIVAGDVIFELRTSQGKAIPITGESSLTDALDQVSVSEEVTLLLTRSSGSDRTNMEVRVQLQPPKA